MYLIEQPPVIRSQGRATPAEKGWFAMRRPASKTTLRVLLSALALVVVAAPAAQADWAPQNAAVTYAAGIVFIRYSDTTVNCSLTSTGVNPPARNSRLSLSTTFARCRETTLGLAVNPVCRGSKTLTIRAFAPPSGNGTVMLDANFNCTFAVPVAGCAVTVQGPQAAGPFIFTNRTQLLHETFVAVGTDNGGFCSGDTAARTNRGNVTYTVISPPDIFITVS